MYKIDTYSKAFNTDNTMSQEAYLPVCYDK
jgi:hypothetical protein